MRRKAITAVVAVLALGLFTMPAMAQSNGAGKSGEAV